MAEGTKGKKEMLLFGGRSAAPAHARGLLSALLGAVVALWVVCVALDVQDMRSHAARPLKASQGGASARLPRSPPRHGLLGGHKGHF